MQSAQDDSKLVATRGPIPGGQGGQAAAGAAKGLNDNAHGIDRFGYRARCLLPRCCTASLAPDTALTLLYVRSP